MSKLYGQFLLWKWRMQGKVLEFEEDGYRYVSINGKVLPVDKSQIN